VSTTETNPSAEPAPPRPSAPDERRFETATERLSKWGDDPTRPGGPKKNVSLFILIGLLAILGLFGGWAPLFFVGALIVIITLHELGHFVTAKASGMKVTEYFLGFGPRLWSIRRGETEYGIKAIPAGAYVKIIGMHNLDTDVAPEDEGRTYRQQSYPKRMAVALAGSTMHFLIALVLLFVILVGFGAPGGAILGAPDASRWQIVELSKLTEGPSPAVEAGLQLGDKIVAVDGNATPTFDEVRTELRERPGEQVTLTVLRDGKTFDTTATLADSNPATKEQGVGFLGVGPGPSVEHVGVLAAVPRAFGEFGAGMKQTFGFFGSFFSPHGIHTYADQVMGRDSGVTNPSGTPGATTDTTVPVRPSSIIGVVRVAGEAAKFGFDNLLILLAAINIFIGIFNLIPLLPFDGGHAAIATYERIRSRNGRRYFVDVVKLMPLTYMVVFVLGLLFLSTTYLDIFRFSS
jgi:membrane-associated protease RseP (regulator of RpoE activity)